MEPAHLFFYGTLRPSHAPPEIASTVALLRPAGSGTIRARLFQLTGYPGAVLDEAAAPISGELFELPEDPRLRTGILERLDDYEGFLPERPAASLFLRVQCSVTLEDGPTLMAWVYVFNRV